MINLHLSGDIVRCPDISAMKKRLSEQRDKRQICKYNVHEHLCPVWRDYIKNSPQVKSFSSFGRCNLNGCDKCPGYLKQKNIGSLAKTYQVNNTNYRKMKSAIHDLVKTSQYKTLFLTLTFPLFKIIPNEKQVNECFSKFIENLRSNYNCTGYIAVREYGEKFNRVHFHVVCSIPFTNFVILNNAWCHAISGFCEYSKNAVRTTRETLFIHNPARALWYVCKYFAKSKHQVSSTRLIFMSNNLIKKPIQIIGSVIDILAGFKGIYINQSSDYTTLFRITNPTELNRFFNEYLYDAFNKFFNYPIFDKNPVNFCSPGSG